MVPAHGMPWFPEPHGLTYMALGRVEETRFGQWNLILMPLDIIREGNSLSSV